MNDDGLTVGVVGATGAAGSEIVSQLVARGFPYRTLRLFGSERTAGALVDDDVSARVELLAPESGRGVDVAFFAAGPRVAGAHAPAMAALGTLVVDVSSAFRDDPDVPLVVPEVNAEAIGASGRRLLAIPSPTASVLAAVLAPLGHLRGVRRAVVSTYQGAGTAGTRSLRALARETVALLGGRAGDPSRHPLAFECRPLIGALGDDGASGHEASVQRELGRVLGAAAPAVQLTAVRIPVFSGIGVSVVVELDAPLAADEAAEALRRAPGLVVHAGDDVPTARSVGGSPVVHVGRVRRDASHPAAIALWAVADGIAKGRAGAAVSVAEIAIRGRDA